MDKKTIIEMIANLSWVGGFLESCDSSEGSSERIDFVLKKLISELEEQDETKD